uniref:Uncharacterized protein n=1 Tax=Tanacetum cinerariifolium TaxID=118510 RepID=A0A6L2J7A8_TANCI|nr:hypothetical protein [Tanacetum cinerariifolium]
MDDVSNQGRMIADMDEDDDVVLEEAKDVKDDVVADNAKVVQDADVQNNADIQGRTEEDSEPAELQEVVDIVTTAKIITEVVTAASTTITAADAVIPAATTTTDLKLTTAPSKRIKGVVIRDSEESTTTTTSTIIHSKAKSNDKGKGILVEEPKPLKKQAQIEQDEKYARELKAELNRTIDYDEVIDYVNKKEKEDKFVKRYQGMKRKPQTKAQARKNMMVYLKNVAGFKMDYFKGMTYDDIRPVFEKHFDSNADFLQKTKEQINEKESRALKRINETPAEKEAKRKKLDEEVEELKRHLQIVPNNHDDVYIEATPLARKVPVVDYEIYNENNKPYYKIIRSDGTHQLYISFLSLLRNFDREDLEALWSLVKETGYTCSNLEKSKKCSWSSKSQELEAVGIMCCIDNYIYNNTVDFADRVEISTHKILHKLLVNQDFLRVVLNFIQGQIFIVFGSLGASPVPLAEGNRPIQLNGTGSYSATVLTVPFNRRNRPVYEKESVHIGNPNTFDWLKCMTHDPRDEIDGYEAVWIEGSLLEE